ncbi:P-loop containing nucleoside triphosphate hydrolase protein [Mycena olivaceomarginata]|nr:P-loop containing nucleoside triphosphate hydrolase protein [Mycena olivaceomarginata]
MDSNPSNNWSPAQQHVRFTSFSTSKSVSTPVSTPLHTSTSTLNSPGNPLAPVLSQKQYRGGYEGKPKALTFKPYALNNPGTPTQAAFDLSKEDPIQSIDALDPEQWSKLAVEMELLPPGAELHTFQVQETVLISPTGSGKSLTWTLPLTARKEGISLVVTPFTSLGKEGELLSQTGQISSLFIYLEQNSQNDYEKAAKGETMVLYVCPETLKSPFFARLLHSASWRKRLSAIYLDEAHLVHQTGSWCPSYSRIYQLRNIVGNEAFCVSLVTYAGLHPDYVVLNLGNFRPELSTMIVPMQHDIGSFLDIAFILPLGSHMQLPTHVVDIIHSGLSSRHQEMALKDFREGKTHILLGSSKISAGINFPGVQRVIQYGYADQQRGRGARQEDETGDITVEHPGDQDFGMIELIQSEECAEKIIQKLLGNAKAWTRHESFDCCNRCDPTYRPPGEYK